MHTMTHAGPTHDFAPNPFAAGCAYIDAQFLAIAAACMPIAATRFTRSDCAYDVVATWRGNFLRRDDHRARFECLWRALRLKSPWSPPAIG